jgi:hypothetical protein
MSEKQSKPTGKDTPFPFEGQTRGFCGGGNSVSTECGTEKHDGPYAKGKTFGQTAKISRCVNGATDSTLAESEVTGGKRQEIGAAELVRRKNSHARDNRTVSGTHFPADITIGK